MIKTQIHTSSCWFFANPFVMNDPQVDFFSTMDQIRKVITWVLRIEAETDKSWFDT